MTGPNGHLNGSGKPSNVESLEEARRRAAERKKQDARALQGPVESASLRDWIIGGIVLLMVAGFFAQVFGLFGSGGPLR